MVTTVTVTGFIPKVDGTPWEDFTVRITRQPSTFTVDASLPEASIEVKTNDLGEMPPTILVGNVAHLVEFPDVFVQHGTGAVSYPKGSRFVVVTPESGTVTLAALQAAAGVPVAPTTILDVVEAELTELAATLADLAGLDIGTVTSGETASATITGEPPNQVVNLVLPEGMSAYEVAADAGFGGDVAAWLASLIGPVGPPPTLAIGDVTEGEAAAEITGSDGVYTVGFTVPKGNTGEPGPPNSLSIGAVETGGAAATITGTAPTQTLNLTLPPGNLPPGGYYGQVLAKASSADYDYRWVDPPGIPLPLLWLPMDGSLVGVDRDGSITATGIGAVRFIEE